MGCLISIWDVDYLLDKKFCKKSLYLYKALKQLKNKNKFQIKENEQVIDLGELLLECYNVAHKIENKRGKGD